MKETEQHKKLKDTAKRQLKSEGFDVIIEEKAIQPEGNKNREYAVDVAGYKDKVSEYSFCKAVECGNTDYDKLAKLKEYYDIVKHIPYEDRTCWVCQREENKIPSSEKGWHYIIDFDKHICPVCRKSITELPIERPIDLEKKILEILNDIDFVTKAKGEKS